MMGFIRHFSLLLFPLGILAVEVKRPRGVSLLNRPFYDESKPFTCLDGSLTIPFDQVNDDYCDCKDGSDEPGTAACPNGRFHCTNLGYKPQYLPSSRVNDGICDCCDTSDEYNSGIVCENTCRELGLQEKESLLHMAEVAKVGFTLKKQLIEEAKKMKEENKVKLAELQEGKKSLIDQVETLRAAKDAAEIPEKEAKEVHEKAWEERKAVVELEKERAKALEIFVELDADEDGVVSIGELQSHTELDSDGDGVLSEAEAQALLGDVSHVEVGIFQEIVWHTIKDKFKSEVREKPTPAPLYIPYHYRDEMDYYPMFHHRHHPLRVNEDQDDTNGEEPTLAPIPDRFIRESPEEYIRTTQATKKEDEEEKMPLYDEHTQNLVEAANRARSAFEAAERSLREMEDSIRDLENEITFDFGPSGEFAYLYSQCYELTTNEYVYRLCPFHRVTQKQKGGGAETNLGTWGSWSGPEENKFTSMKYEHGTSCWQGPNRSTTVKLSCGKETAVTSTTEPSRCEYLMEFVTPALCEEPQDIDNSTGHDEL
ncbi:glucosidase 2 subunit beta isoform X2 [Protopterus annectens]|nr:glucosidase 2 subunit beta isoform X2 [Protopterus annectens]XP_043940557.1 glucosidase 2 subunit beta isoform X2 [Protopterus annectens]